MLCNEIDEKDLGKYHLKGYVAQQKIDGIRCLAICDLNGVQLFGRNGTKLNDRFPEIVEELKVFNDIILDGEIVCDTFEHTTSRALTQNKTMSKLLMEKYPAKYMVFDELIASKTFVERQKRLIERDFTRFNRICLLPSDLDIIGLFEKAKTLQWEGIVLKKLDSEYLKGFCKIRTNNWLKCKIKHTKDIIVNKYETNSAGIRAEGEGFAVQISGSQSKAIQNKINETGSCKIEVEYLNETGSGMLRQIVFKEMKQ